MGDFSAKVGNRQHALMVGNEGLGEYNERGGRFIDQMIVSTCFTEHPRHVWT